MWAPIVDDLHSKKGEGVTVDFLWHLVEAVKDLPTHEVCVFQVS